MMCCCGGHGHMQEESHDHSLPAAKDDPEAILKTRLARGEITIEEYQRLLDVLKR